MVKRITLKAIKAEVGKIDGSMVADHQAFLMVFGASEWLAQKAIWETQVSGTDQPSNAQLKKLARQLMAPASRKKH